MGNIEISQVDSWGEPEVFEGKIHITIWWIHGESLRVVEGRIHIGGFLWWISSLPKELRLIKPVDSFKARLKTHYLTLAFNV